MIICHDPICNAEEDGDYGYCPAAGRAKEVLYKHGTITHRVTVTGEVIPLAIITDVRSPGERMNWQHGEHTGTIAFPMDERGPVDIQWDNNAPDNWEEIEQAIERAASDSLCAKPTA
jgi:hypothetical protein